ncbi:MAG: ABC transporter ATP-binding protein [Methanotrichaceae archaeon]|nr:ABC transporter ATP-binding protein [Methanotrichaceae archaeon]
MSAVVEVEDLWKSFQIPHERRTTLFENLTNFFRPNNYETYAALKGINFSVEKGDCIGIIGDNGSGKSTLLKIIANIMRPTKGKVVVTGKMTPFLELGVGFQPDLTARENVGVYATIMGLKGRDIEGRTDEILEFAGLQKFEDTKLKNLSSGMQVRLAFSTAVQTEPDILLVDEVLAVGDIEFQQKCFEVFDNYKKEGVTILFVSHDLQSVRMFCDKTLLLRGGEQVEFGDTNRVIDKYIYKSDEQDEVQSKNDKWGTKKVEIFDVKFLDKNGSENTNFISGDPLRIRIFYNSAELVKSPIFGIIVYHQDTYCYGTTTDFMNQGIPYVFGKGHVDFYLEKLSLLEGKFDFTIAVASPDYESSYDWHDRLYSIQVHKRTQNLGLFDLGGSWNVERYD